MKKASGIGGQALMEGVMMKNGSHYACAVRKPDGTIEVDDQRTTLLSDKYKIFKLPIIRGVVTFVESLVIGVKTLTWSASFLEDEEEDTAKKDEVKEEPVKSEEPEYMQEAEEISDSITEDNIEDNNIEEISLDGEPETGVQAEETAPAASSGPKIKKAEKKEKTGAEKTKESLIMGLLVVFAIVFAIGLFMILPYFISKFLKTVITSQFLLALIEGIIRICLFVGYVAAISCMKDIKRVFMYHGAEHKSINCVESGKELTVENVRECSREHKRCGTSFLLIVMVISIIFFMFIRFESTLLMVLGRLILIPLIAGISYEFIRLAGRSDNKLVIILSKPGLALQKLTTREPDDSMIECAIASVEAVFDWRAYQADLKAEEEAELREKQERREKRRLEREAEIRQRMEAKGRTVDDLSEEQIKEIDARADKLAAKEMKNDEIAEKLAREAAEKAKQFEKAVKTGNNKNSGNKNNNNKKKK
ncbi:MAG: DUF1385 domain-containing protein [Lachnospiraceae bacterium]|nr:DUF1385 domain-containing protein [Lachnospiraceae bacterium]